MATTLLAAQTSVVAVFTALQVTDDVVSRMARNHPLLTAGAFVLAAMALAVGLFLRSYPKASTVLGALGIVLLLAALFVATAAAVQVSTDQDSPRVTASLERSKGAPRLSAQVNASSVASDDVVHIQVEPLDDRLRPSGSLYRATVGPDLQGEVDHAISLVVDPYSSYAIGIRAWINEKLADECFRPDTTFDRSGCVALELGGFGSAPLLDASLTPSASGGRKLTVDLSAEGPAVAPIWLSAREVGGRERKIVRLRLAPDLSGALQRTFELQVPDDVGEICVAARRGREGECGDTHAQDTAWIELATPSASSVTSPGSAAR